MARRFFYHIELWLSAAGLAVVWLAARAAMVLETDPWTVAALTALTVSVLHGVIFWVVRSRQRAVRLQAVHEVREMLQDEVRNQLAVLAASLPSRERAEYAGQFEDINGSIEQIAAVMDGLTEEKLSAWKRTYANAAPHFATA